ncbi:MAG: HAD family hydrolase [Selenomonas sp.]|uniref:HAD family hydrolase n=1 Tax=Selenomonas sp. TaxID=2053611 RepID=UPI0025EFDBAB|nr:HAD family hydrolase [Selenomonas sp.]MCI6233370.1 HAD family hydrolase [Selenomonas sp.]
MPIIQHTYRAAIFDLDGTLVNSLDDLADSANAMLSSYGFPTHPVDPYRYFVGNGSRKLIERCLPKEQGSDPAFVDEALARYKEIYAQHTQDKTRPYDGIQDMLDELQRRHIPLGICTNKHQSAAEDIVNAMFPAGTFQSIMGDQPSLPRKPDPKKVLMIAEKFGVGPSAVAYFGDTSVDMDTAKNAGFFPVGVLWGFRPKEELVEHGAKVLLEKPMELFEKVAFGK